MSVDDDELRARLHALDPAASLLPVDTASAARLLEDAMTHEEPAHDESRADHTHGRSALTWIVAAATVVLIGGAGVVGVLTLTGEDDGPADAIAEASVTELAAPAAGASGKCMVPSADVLRGQSLAFAGTVTDVSDEVVELEATEFYTGEPTDVVRVQAAASDLVALAGFVDFEVGQDYLVAANDGWVTVCGFSGPATTELSALYDEAFPGLSG